jgi:alpha-methylacyl-CoA racemase
VSAGPLAGLKVVEFAGLGPVAFAGMMLADLGADVTRIARPAEPAVSPGDPALDVLLRGRTHLTLDLRAANGVAETTPLIARADILIEGFRPGVMERLGLGPEPCVASNPGLIYVRLTGWGQTGPLARKAGHDINYLAVAGGLHPMGPPGGPPLPPLNYVGDFGGGGMLAVVGALAALAERARTGRGAVIDAAMVDGIGVQMALLYSWRAMGFWTDVRGENLLDGGAYFYRCYETLGGDYLAVGALEPQFHRTFVEGLGLDPESFEPQYDRSAWLERGDRVARVIAGKTRAAWVEHFAGLDCCVSPVLTPSEAVQHPASRARAAHVKAGGHWQPCAAPRFL